MFCSRKFTIPIYLISNDVETFENNKSKKNIAVFLFGCFTLHNEREKPSLRIYIFP